MPDYLSCDLLKRVEAVNCPTPAVAYLPDRGNQPSLILNTRGYKILVPLTGPKAFSFESLSNELPVPLFAAIIEGFNKGSPFEVDPSSLYLAHRDGSLGLGDIVTGPGYLAIVVRDQKNALTPIAINGSHQGDLGYTRWRLRCPDGALLCEKTE